ncbi:MAG: bifunctional DNA-formamidopyrimidine glycosylase/DNA-(apurinic or apyrimidinic site) lyase [Polyangiaceae bacterium]|nr:bifunctional DNA-formamidopyrimidine glycosylase/DNA-(apurinic or apyrimidinic site) lyase [Polyangiaceae bacterium]
MRHLRRWMRGATIARAHSTDRRILRPGSPAAFGRTLSGRRVISIDRRGKWLRIELDGEVLLFSHLGMTGEWIASDRKEPAQRSERARLDLRGRGRHAESVRYLDARRFGRLVVTHEEIPEWEELGPDPLDRHVTPSSLAESVGRSRRPIKVVLMDQTILAGVGNILATEALWRARIDPRSRSDALSRTEMGAILRGLRTVIRREIKELAAGDDPRFQIYGRAGEPCPRCKTTIRRIVLGGRSTTFCEGCQVRAEIAKRD